MYEVKHLVVNFLNSSIGRLIVCEVSKGTDVFLAYIAFCENENDESAIREEIQIMFPNAEITKDCLQMEKQVLSSIEGSGGEMPPILRHSGATPFQLLVWDELNKIPYGQTVSYSQLAESIGKPSAVRAVASACGKNRVAVITPCHRVIAANGGLGGYRWGVDKKMQLLINEGYSM